MRFTNETEPVSKDIIWLCACFCKGVTGLDRESANPIKFNWAEPNDVH